MYNRTMYNHSRHGKGTGEREIRWKSFGGTIDLEEELREHADQKQEKGETRTNHSKNKLQNTRGTAGPCSEHTETTTRPSKLGPA